MTGRPARRSALGAACVLGLFVAAPGLGGTPASADEGAAPPSAVQAVDGAPVNAPPDEGGAPPGSPPTKPPPRGFLIYLTDGGDPIVVKEYVEEQGNVRFEKFGGWVGIPRDEILKIVPDEPETSATLPPAPPAPVATDDGLPAAAGPDALYVTLQGGVSMKATSVTPEGNRVRITVPDGSFTVARGDLVGVVRMPSSGDTPEVWLTAVATEEAPDGAMGGARPTEPTAPAPPRRGISVPAPSSDRPHLLRLANGQRLRIDGFWIENGELRFRRFGGLVGVALSEVTRLIPEAAAAPARGLTPVRFVQQVTPDLLEVRVGTGSRRVRLIGVEPAADAPTADNPLARLDRGVVLQLEFDRQRSDARGDWLAYVYLPNGRMLNAELIRLRLARPRADSHNVRHLDLFEELGNADAGAD